MRYQLYVISVAVLLLVLYGPQVLSQQVQNLGCFDLSFALNQNMHTHINNVGFSSCAAHCLAKGTSQMGIERSDHFCYCGNDIAEESTKKDDQYCSVPCEEGHNHTCGGEWLMSVYKFTELTTSTTSTQTTVLDTEIGNNIGFLLGLSNGTRLYRSNNMTVYDKIASSNVDSVFKVDYHYSKGWAYVWTSKGLLRASLFGKQTDDNGRAKQVSKGATRGCEGFAVDWVEDRLYFAICSTYGVQISSMDLDGNNVTTLLIRPGNSIVSIKRMEVDPYRRKLFWIADGVIESCDLSGNNYFTNVSAEGVTVRALFLDLEARQVFYFGMMGNLGSLYKMHYQGGVSTRLYSEMQMSSVFGMGVFRDSVYWVTFARALDIIYKARKTPRRTHIHNTAIIKTVERAVWDMKLVHPDLQKMPKNDFCPQGLRFLPDKDICDERGTEVTPAMDSKPKSKPALNHTSFESTQESSNKDVVPVSTIGSTTRLTAFPISHNNEAQDYIKVSDSSPSRQAYVRSSISTKTVILLSVGLFLVGILVLASLAYLVDTYSSDIRGRLLRVSYQRERGRGDNVPHVERPADRVTLI